jgi:hypothetical protein
VSDEDVTIHAPGIPTTTSDRPTRPIRPEAIRQAAIKRTAARLAREAVEKTKR